MAGKLLAIKYGPVYLQFDHSDNVLITRDDCAQSIRLSYSEFMHLIRATWLHGWPIAPPVVVPGDYTYTVEDMDAPNE